MATVHIDVVGLYINSNGSVWRPVLATKLKAGDKVKVYYPSGSMRLKVNQNPTTKKYEEAWLYCHESRERQKSKGHMYSEKERQEIFDKRQEFDRHLFIPSFVEAFLK